MAVSVSNYLDNQGIKRTPIWIDWIENGTVKKGNYCKWTTFPDCSPLMDEFYGSPKHEKLTSDQLLKRNQTRKSEYLAHDCSEIGIIDIDVNNKNDWSDFTKQLIRDYPHYKSVSNEQGLSDGKIHIFTSLHNESGKKVVAEGKFAKLNFSKGELLANWAFAKGGSTVYNSDKPICDIDLSDKIILRKEVEEKYSCTTVLYTNELEKFFLKISSRFLGNYEDWYRVMCTTYNVTKNRDLMEEVSKLGKERFSKSASSIIKLYEKLESKPTKEKPGFGTLCWYLKNTNEDVWENFKRKIINNQLKFELKRFFDTGAVISEYTCARIFYEKYKNDYLFCGDVKKGEWYRISEYGIYETLPNATEIISRDLMGWMWTYLNELKKNEEDKDKHDQLAKSIKALEKWSFQVAVSNFLKVSFMKTRIKDKFDCLDNLLGFDNGVIDIVKKEDYKAGEPVYKFRKARADEFVTQSVGYPFPTDEEVTRIRSGIHFKEALKVWDDLYTEAQRIDGGKGFVQKIMGSCLEGGNPEQKCFCYIGDGSNGKKILAAIREAVLGLYYHNLSSKFWTNQVKAGQADPELMKVRKARHIETAEIGDEKIDDNKWKSLVACDKQEGRQLYSESNDRGISIKSKISFQANDALQFKSGQVNHSNARRLDYVRLDNTFMNIMNILYNKENPLHKIEDPDLVNKIEGELKLPFLLLMLDWLADYKQEGFHPIPKSISEATQELQSEADIVSNFISEFLVKVEGKRTFRDHTNVECGILISDIHTDFNRFTGKDVEAWSTKKLRKSLLDRLTKLDKANYYDEETYYPTRVHEKGYAVFQHQTLDYCNKKIGSTIYTWEWVSDANVYDEQEYNC